MSQFSHHLAFPPADQSGELPLRVYVAAMLHTSISGWLSSLINCAQGDRVSATSWEDVGQVNEIYGDAHYNFVDPLFSTPYCFFSELLR